MVYQNAEHGHGHTCAPGIHFRRLLIEFFEASSECLIA
jgi:hypothetical protein